MSLAALEIPESPGKRVGGRGNPDSTPPDPYVRCKTIPALEPRNRSARNYYHLGLDIAYERNLLSWTTVQFLKAVTWWRSGPTLNDMYAFHQDIADKNKRSRRWSEHHMHKAVLAGFVIRQHRMVGNHETGYWKTTSTRWRFLLPELVDAEVKRRHAEVVAKKTEEKNDKRESNASGKGASRSTSTAIATTGDQSTTATGEPVGGAYRRSMSADLRAMMRAGLAVVEAATRETRGLPPPRR